MRINFTCLFFLASVLISSAQDAYPKLEGIGKFKINSTNRSIVEDISKELRCQVNMINSFEAYYQFSKESPKIFQIAPYDNNFSGNPPNSPNCPGVEVFYINSYSVSDIPMTNIFLTFEDGILVQFVCDPSSEFREAIKIKYGAGKLETVKKTVSCVTKLTGVTTKYEEDAFYQTWENDGVSATLLLSVYYNDRCEKRYLNSFTVKDDLAIKSITQCERQNRLKVSQSKEEEQRKKLADF